MEAGAAANVRWRDCGGEHTPLSKALVLRNLPLAELLVQRGAGRGARVHGSLPLLSRPRAAAELRPCGAAAQHACHGLSQTRPLSSTPPTADPTAALLCTSLLESSRFEPELVKWLLDRGAGVAVPPLSIPGSSSGDGALAPGTPDGGDGGGGGSGSQGPLPATAVLLRKLQRELHVSRQLSKLHAAAGAEQERWLLRRAADCLTLLLAAGAAPVDAPGPGSSAAAAAAAVLEPADWEAVRQAASALAQQPTGCGAGGGAGLAAVAVQRAGQPKQLVHPLPPAGEPCKREGWWDLVRRWAEGAVCLCCRRHPPPLLRRQH